MARLGGSSFVITPGTGTWQLETRLNAIMKGAAAEHIREGIPVLASYCDALGVRAFAEGKNLANEYYYAGPVESSGGWYGTPGVPRTYGVTLMMKF